jgi:protein-tyrosine-phosphatase
MSVFESIRPVKLEISRRNLIGTALAVLMTSGCVGRQSRYVPVVLFVCQFGTAKSAIAREVFRAHARERRLAVNGFSRGITIEDHVTPQLRQNLAADGIDPLADKPELLTPGDWQRADIVVAFNPLPLAVPHTKVRDWTDLPSINDEYARTRALMDQRIGALLDEIARRA